MITLEQLKNLKLALPLNLIRINHADTRSSVVLNLDTGKKRRSEGPYINPYGLTQFFGWNQKKYAPLRGHPGLDFFTTVPSPVYAMLEGKVTTGYDKYGGSYVKLRNTTILSHLHADVELVYFHLKGTLVLDGDYVKKGQRIAISGNTGEMTTGPHLHAELRIYISYGMKMVRQSNGYAGGMNYLSLLTYKDIDGDLLERFDGAYIQRTDTVNGGHGEVYFVNGYKLEHIKFTPSKAFSNALRHLAKDKMLTGINEEVFNKLKGLLI